MKNTKRSVSKVRNAAKMMLATLTFGVCMCLFSFESLAAEGTVKPSSAKIRSEANTSSTALASVKSGDELTIKAKTTGADGNVWYQVFVDADTLGFIRSDLVEADGSVPEMQATSSQTDTSNSADSSQIVQVSASDVEQMANQSATVTGGDVNVRADASTSSSKVTTAKNGTAITVTGKVTGSDSKVWYQVNFINNGTEVTGFIRSDYVELGEIIEEIPQEEEPAEETEVTEEPVQSQNKEYDTVLESKEDGTQEWYLYDYGSGLKYSIPDLMTVTQNNAEADGVMEKQLKQQKIVIIVLVVLVVILVLGVTLLFFKLHDGEMDDEDEDDEQFEEMLTRKRREERSAVQQQSRRPAASADRPQRRPVQEGAAARPKQAARPVRAAEGEHVRRPAAQTARTANPAAQAAQTARTTNPAAQAGQTARTANPTARQTQTNGMAAQRTAAPKQRPAAPKMPEREVTYEEEPKLDVKKQNGQWHSKNFLTDDDEFEFEFLNMDDPNRL